jgi:plastocyanin
LEDIIPKLVEVKVARTQIPPLRIEDGQRIWTVRMVGNAQTFNVFFILNCDVLTICLQAALFRFTPENITVCEGDIVEFVNDGLDIHTVTFTTPGLNPFFITKCPNYWLKIGEMEEFLEREGEISFFNARTSVQTENNSSFTGGFANSGILMPLYRLDPNPLDLPHSWSIRFASPGEFPYVVTYIFSV